MSKEWKLALSLDVTVGLTSYVLWSHEIINGYGMAGVLIFCAIISATLTYNKGIKR